MTSLEQADALLADMSVLWTDDVEPLRRGIAKAIDDARSVAWVPGPPTAVGSYWICSPDQSGKLHVWGPATVYRKLGSRAGELMDRAKAVNSNEPVSLRELWDRREALQAELNALPLYVLSHGSSDGALVDFWPVHAHAPYSVPAFGGFK